MRNYVSARSSADDVWTLKQKGSARSLKLRYVKVEGETVHPVPGGRWRALTDFVTTDGKTRYFAEAVVSTGGDLWDVKSLRWLVKEQIYDRRSEFVRAAAAAASRKPAPFGSLPELTFPDAQGRETFIPECAKSRCLTVYVAPWCPACRSATAAIQALQGYLPSRGIPVRVVVGADEDAKLRAYAREFGEKTLLDAGGRWDVGGVPHFFVSDDVGGVHVNKSGAWSGLGPEEFSRRLGLP